MKVEEILVEAPSRVKGNWNITNLRGWTKSFKDETSPEALAWMRDKTSKPEPREKLTDYEKYRREMAKIERDTEREKKKNKPKPLEIFRKVEDAIGNSFPDGDPIDSLIPWFKKTGVTMDEVDAAVKQYAGKKTSKKYGMYEYLADMWDDRQADEIGDAKNGHIDDDSLFYSIGADGKIEPEDNPWK